MKKVIYIVSDIEKALAFEWIATSIDKEKVQIIFVLLNKGNSSLEEFLVKNQIQVHRIQIKNKLDFLRAYAKVASFFIREKPDIVHCHLRTSELIGIPTAFFLRVKRRIYTRHSSTYNHLYHPKGVWVDKLISKLATDIVAISKNVRSILFELENVKKKKVKLIPHGFDLNLFDSVSESRVEQIKRKYKLEEGAKVIGIIARYIWLKGYAYSIPGIGRIMKENPNVFLVIANAKGNDEQAIRKLIKKHIPENRLREIVFESDLAALYKLFDCYVHVPFDSTAEAFGQTYVEALASGVPSVFTLSGIAPEFIQHDYNALVVDFKNQEQIEIALRRLLNDRGLCVRLVENGKSSLKSFSLKDYVESLEKLYVG